MGSRIVTLVLLLALIPRAALPQSVAVSGSVVDSTTHAPIADVLVRLTNARDSTDVRPSRSSDDGGFRFEQLRPGPWRLEATRIGYAVLRRTLLVTGVDQNLGTLALNPMVIALPEVVVRRAPPAAMQFADTTQFSARAVRTHP